MGLLGEIRPFITKKVAFFLNADDASMAVGKAGSPEPGPRPRGVAGNKDGGPT